MCIKIPYLKLTTPIFQIIVIRQQQNLLSFKQLNARNSSKPGKQLYEQRVNVYIKIKQNYAYRLLELEISIDEVGLTIGRNKKQDISQLIQLYMLGVQVLESTGDSRFRYFRTKLHDLMLKRQVIKQLKFTTPQDIIKKEKEIRQQKRKEHETQLLKTQEYSTKQVSSIIHSAATTVENYKQSIQSTLKKQQNQIKERLNSRNKKSQLRNQSIPKSTVLKKQPTTLNIKPSPCCSSPPLPKSKKQIVGIQHTMQNSPIQKPLCKIPKIPKHQFDKIEKTSPNQSNTENQ